MSTRAFIGIEVGKDAIVGVYCHSDGYPSYLGKVLYENYSGLDVWKLISVGDMRNCGVTIEECDGFANEEGYYKCMPRFHHNLEEIYERQNDFEYVYVYVPIAESWFFNKRGESGWKALTKYEWEEE